MYASAALVPKITGKLSQNDKSGFRRFLTMFQSGILYSSKTLLIAKTNGIRLSANVLSQSKIATFNLFKSSFGFILISSLLNRLALMASLFIYYFSLPINALPII